MDYLNSLSMDLDIINRRSHRVRSWYLYEQYKSLERNQLDAAKKLKDKTYQEKILRQELFERKARRQLYDQFGSSQSESGKEEGMKSNDNKTTLSVSADDFFESFCELHEDEIITHVTEQDSSEESFSQDDSVILKSFTADFKSVENPKDDNSYADSVKSVIENIKSIENLEKTHRGADIAKDLNLKLDEAKENIECIEKVIELSDSEKTSENESGLSIVEYKTKHVGTENSKSKKQNNNVFAMWSRLVSFAYQIIKINHGNCYYDYSSQLLTAVLACDVLRRGISRMCMYIMDISTHNSIINLDILRIVPYVSPIKFATDDESDSSAEHHKNVKRKLKQTKKIRKSFGCKIIPSHKAIITGKHRLPEKYRSEDCWRPNSKSFLDKHINKKNYRWASEPWRSMPKFAINKEDSSEHSSLCGSSIWPGFSKENMCGKNICDCTCCKRFRDPMLQIAQYIDSILKI